MSQTPENDPFRAPIANELSAKLMEAFMRLSNVLESQVEGSEGPVDLPPEQFGEAIKNVALIIMDYLPKIATKLDVLAYDVAALKDRLDDAGAS